MNKDLRRATRQYLTLLTILLCSLLLVTCLGDKEGECNERTEREFNRAEPSAQPLSQSQGRAE